ncbi:MAG: TlyA family RNA methyltransferase [Deltaproteobacteria bacterium]|nr:TlyA family RNA methyltransferase [Deltaproteobacteria bacterium]
MAKTEKTRIDTLLVEKGLAPTREKSQALIMAGSVLVDGAVVDKPGREVKRESVIEVKAGLPFVGRGGVKLSGALEAFNICVEGLTIVDIGSSTGGFTDCVLKRGAKKVYAIDVGKSLLDCHLRNDPRVVVLEGYNIRHFDLALITDPIDMAVIDVSFISLEKVLPKAEGLVRENGTVLALVKPQFEAGKGRVGKGGIVRDEAIHREVVDKIKAFALDLGFRVAGEAQSSITGTKGNREFWVWLVK